MRLAATGLGRFFLARFTEPSEPNKAIQTIDVTPRITMTLRVRLSPDDR